MWEHFLPGVVLRFFKEHVGSFIFVFKVAIYIAFSAQDVQLRSTELTTFG